jgi:hypothetical protein
MLEDFTDSNRPNKERLPRVFDVMGWNGFKSGEIGDEDFRIVQRNSDDLLLLGGDDLISPSFMAGRISPKDVEAGRVRSGQRS